MKDSIRQIVDELFNVANLVVGTKDDDNEKTISQRVKREVLNFLMYLSASDGSIGVAEALFIKDYFDEQISPEEICQRIEEDNLYSSTFEQKVPIVLKRLVRLDNKEFQENNELEYSRAERYICLYEALGKEFIACDREVAQSEKDDLNTYIGNMRSFYAANYAGPDEATQKGHKEYKISPVEVARNQSDKGKAMCQEEGEETLEDLINELNSLIGLYQVKSTVSQLVHFDTVSKVRQERGLEKMPMTKHMVFYGNPGTGKTTVARLIAKIYHKLGILSKGHLVEVDRSGLVAGYVGHTALKVKEVVREARGGVLFIDEAYALTYKRSENDFGWEAVDTLIKAMEDYRDDMVVIVAGYPERMVQFIDSNPGLKSRFNRFIKFRDYTGEELYQIYLKMLGDMGFAASDIVKGCAEEFLEDAYMSRGENFANARLVRNYIESAVMNQADRLYGMGIDELTDAQLCTLEHEDVRNLI